jgi:hypothetical protein
MNSITEDTQMTDIIMSIFMIAGGVTLIFFALGEILVRIMLALLGLWLINYGFKLRGKGSLYTRVHNWYIFRRF